MAIVLGVGLNCMFLFCFKRHPSVHVSTSSLSMKKPLPHPLRVHLCHFESGNLLKAVQVLCRDLRLLVLGFDGRCLEDQFLQVAC